MNWDLLDSWFISAKLFPLMGFADEKKVIELPLQIGFFSRLIFFFCCHILRDRKCKGEGSADVPVCTELDD